MNRERLRALMSRRARVWVAVGVTLAAFAAILFAPRIPQDPAYHVFADRRAFLSIPNFLDVTSNVAFLLVGALGLGFLLRPPAAGPGGPFLESRERGPYGVFFLGVTLTSFGSAYYHLAPSNARLVWDRLPMTLGFMSFLSAIIAERIGVTAGLRMLPPLLALGAGSVGYWHWSELAGAGDLRVYVMVQFYPLLVIPLLMLLFPPRYTRGADLLGVVGFYGLAKVFEIFDGEIFSLGRGLSGHTLKHLVAGVSIYWVLRMLKKRAPHGGEPLREFTGSMMS